MDPHHPSQRTLARYYSVSGKGEAFIWITPTVPANGISRFCTSHPGADNINVTDEIWEDLPIAEAIRNDYIRMMNVYSDDNSSPVYPKWEYWMQFGSMCIGRPVHKGYIRIYHPDNFDNGIDGLYTHLVTPNDDREWLDHTQECRNAFTIAADNFVYYGYAEGMMATYLIPVRVNFVSKEYDKYLSKIIERGFHVDELAEIYSPDCIYTNIDGGLGIFGSLYYWENI